MTSTPRTSTRLRLAVGLVALLAAAGSLACSSDKDTTSTSDTKTGNTAGATPSSMKATGDDKTWCESVIDLAQQSGGGGLSLQGQAAALQQAVTSLSVNAPAALQNDLTTLSASLEVAVQSDPTGTLPPDVQAAAQSSAKNIQTWVYDNCGGYQLQLAPS